MKKRTYVRIISYGLFFLSALAIWGISGNQRASYYRLQLENSYQQTLNELGEYMGNIETTLDKSIYANTDTMVSELSAQLWRESSGAKSSMSKLPLKDLNLENTYKFLAQVGEFSMALNKKTASGGKITQSEHENLLKLSEYAKSFNKSVENMLRFYSGGEKITQDGTGITVNADYQSAGLSNSFNDTESAMTDYPTLIYDGPFSDHLINQTPQMTKDAPEITRNEALENIQGLTGITVGTLNYNGTQNCELSCFNFTDKTKSYSITKSGGYLCSVLDSRSIKEEKVPREECVKKAKSFLDGNGFTMMEPTYYAINDGVCVVNFAFSNDGVIFYTDLIKVGVAMDNGQIVSFDSTGYLMNHKARQLEKPKYGLEECKKNISSYLGVTSAREAVIPTNAGNEVYTYEFHCKSKETNEEVLVYIDTQTGKESNILFLLYTDNGIFVK